MKSIIKDLLYKIEGYGDSPEYDVESIRRSENAIVIVIRLPQLALAMLDDGNKIL